MPTSRADAIAQLATWDAGGVYAAGLHAGDLGWSHRQPDGVEEVATWWEGDALVAVALMDGDSARPRVRPDRIADHALAARVADRIDALDADAASTDVDPGSMLRQELVLRGWTLDPAAWVAFYSPAAAAPTGDIACQRAEVDPAGRVCVQRAGSAGSTFDVARWHRMASGPGYRPDLDLLVLDPADGRPGAAATAWLSVPGGTAVIEPLATHPEHRGRGLGRQAVQAVTDACARAGASGVTVCTPASNTAGVATYLSAGFHLVETMHGLTRTRTRPHADPALPHR